MARLSLAVFAAFAVLYTVLRSLNYTAVDGAERAASVFHRGELFFHGNNHLLYPFNVWVWNGALALLGLGANDPISYIRDTQIMNAVAGAGCVAAVLWIGTKLGKSRFLALAAAIAYGVSRVPILHFTNGAEPPVGLLWSLLAICLLVAGLERGSSLLILISGAVLALALATYQSMLLSGGIAVALCVFWVTASDVRTTRVPIAAKRIALFTLGGLVATVLVFGSAYEYTGTSDIGPKIVRFVTIVGNDVYGGITISKIVNLPVGFAASVLPVLPTNYAGIRALLGRPRAILHLLAIAAPLVVFTAIGVFSVVRMKRRRWAGSPLSPCAGIALLGALAVVLMPCIYWNPIYDKLWLQPLALLAILAPMALRGDSDASETPLFRAVTIGIVLTIAAANLGWAAPASTTPTPEVRSARSVVDVVTPNDLVICDWDGVSALYKALTGPRFDTLDLPSTAEEFGPGAAAAISDRVRAAETRGGTVYFLGVMDQSPEQWQAFLGYRAGLPYNSLDEYRRRARPLDVLATNHATITFWRLDVNEPPDPVQASQ